MLLVALFLLLTVTPVVELALLLWLWEHMGLLQTVLLVIGTGILGATLAKQQGLATLYRIREESSQGKMPADALMDGVLLLLAGAVLITPGVLTDVLGFSLLVPPVRAVIKKGLKHWFASRVQVQVMGDAPRREPPPKGDVIDVEVKEVRVEDA